jgi:hypothetical protein
MKRLTGIALLMLLWTGAVQAQETKPSLLLYISPSEYSHEVRLGFVPYYIVWARKGPALEQATRAALQPYFSEIGMCEGSNGADVVVWLQPYLNYSPPAATYYAEVKARFFRADGKPIGTLTAIGSQPGAFGSKLVEAQVQQAFDKAMQDIAAQFSANTAMQQAIDPSLTRTPCAMVALVPNP